MKSLALFVGGIAIVAAAAGVAVYQYRAAASPAPHVSAAASTGVRTVRFFREPSPAPEFTVRTLDGRTITAADLRGKVTILNFWATWCGPCRAEIPDLIALQQRYASQLQIIGISEDEIPVEQVRQFVVANKMNYPVAMMTPEIEKAFTGISALPTSFIIDRDARIVMRHAGMLNPALTDAETRVLAGLPVDAAVEQVDRIQKAQLENGAQATTIPGVDLASLTHDQRMTALQRLNSEGCTCGCDLSVAKCRIDDPACGVSLPLARAMVKQIAGK